jgi:NitT/TauT family transport system substrate-binding protein
LQFSIVASKIDTTIRIGTTITAQDAGMQRRSAMRKYATGAIVAIGALVVAATTAPAQQGAEDASLAYPNVAFTFAASYVAEDLGLFAKHGLRLKPLSIAGPGATNAVISGSADFAIASTSVTTRAAARGQRLLTIANLTDKPVVQIILRKELAPNFDPKAPLAERVRVMRSRTIAVDAIGSIIHGYPLMLAKRGGFDANEIRIAPMAPPSVLAAFAARQIDGFAMSMPWPIGPVLEGQATLIASGADGDPPDMAPFGQGTIITRPETCDKRKSACQKMGRALAEAVAYLHDHPQETLALLKKRFASLDDKVLAAGFEQVRKATPRPPIIVRGALENGELYSIEAGLLKPDEKLKSYDGLYTDEYVR